MIKPHRSGAQPQRKANEHGTAFDPRVQLVWFSAARPKRKRTSPVRDGASFLTRLEHNHTLDTRITDEAGHLVASEPSAVVKSAHKCSSLQHLMGSLR